MLIFEEREKPENKLLEQSEETTPYKQPGH